MISKAKISDSIEESEILKEFKKQFEVSLPLEHFDLVLVSDLVEKEDTVSEKDPTNEEGADATGDAA